MADQLDLENRDINALNDHVAGITFHDVLGEPDAVHSIDCVWKNSYKCYSCTLSCCYKLLTILCGIPLAFCWGCEFACLSCYHIWYFTPMLKSCSMELMVFKKFLDACLGAFCAPCCETCGLFFSKINVGSAEGGMSKPTVIHAKPFNSAKASEPSEKPTMADVEVASVHSEKED